MYHSVQDDGFGFAVNLKELVTHFKGCGQGKGYTVVSSESGCLWHVKAHPKPHKHAAHIAWCGVTTTCIGTRFTLHKRWHPLHPTVCVWLTTV